MELNDIKTWISIGTGLIAISSFVYAFLTRGSKQNSDRLDRIETALTATTAENVDLKHRVDKYRNEQLALPNKDDFHSVEMTVNTMTGEIKLLRELMSKVSHKVDTIDGYLMDERRGSK